MEGLMPSRCCMNSGYWYSFISIYGFNKQCLSPCCIPMPDPVNSSCSQPEITEPALEPGLAWLGFFFFF